MPHLGTKTKAKTRTKLLCKKQPRTNVRNKWHGSSAYNRLIAARPAEQGARPLMKFTAVLRGGCDALQIVHREVQIYVDFSVYIKQG